MIRERRRSIPALPYMDRLMSFSLLILPSTGPVEIADKPDGSPATDGEALPLEDFLSGLRIAWRGGEVKPTARSKPAAKRERRRPDPLLAVTAELEEWFEAEPWRTSRELLERLQV